LAQGGISWRAVYSARCEPRTRRGRPFTTQRMPSHTSRLVKYRGQQVHCTLRIQVQHSHQIESSLIENREVHLSIQKHLVACTIDRWRDKADGWVDCAQVNLSTFEITNGSTFDMLTFEAAGNHPQPSALARRLRDAQGGQSRRLLLRCRVCRV